MYTRHGMQYYVRQCAVLLGCRLFLSLSLPVVCIVPCALARVATTVRCKTISKY